MFKHTHRDLVNICYKWVVKNCGVGIAFKELKSINEEIPDVIGFDSWKSILIEVKVSRGDFFSDLKKTHRAKGMGNWRFYACPRGMIRREELPPKWGLIYVDDKNKARVEYDCRVKRVKMECTNEWDLKEHPEGYYWQIQKDEDNWFEADTTAERQIMYTALRRLFIKGYMNCIYDKEYTHYSAVEILKRYKQMK